MAVRLCAAASVVLLTAGCGSGDTAVNPADIITYDSLGTRAEIDCENGKSLVVGGSNNTLTVRGICASVSVRGADNRITADRIDGTLSVDGVNNTVGYAAGDPTIVDTGTGNRVGAG